MKAPRILVILGALALLSACAPSATSAPITEITVEATDLKFGQESIEVTAGMKVHLTLRNMGALDHDFSVMEIPVEIHSASEPVSGHEMHGEPQLHLAAAAGQEAFVEFTPTEPGNYQFYCSVSGHKEAGMTGELVVNPP